MSADTTGVTLPRVVHAEWLKLRTLRSSWWTLASAVAALLGIGIIIASTSTTNPDLHAMDAVPSATLQGYLFAELLVGVLGVLFVSGEYGTGSIRSTLAAVPRRWPVLLAKTAVLTAAVGLPMLLTSVVTFVVAQPLLETGSSLDDPGVLRVVLGTGLYLILVALLGSALGWLLRSTAVGISTLVALLLVIPPLLQLLPGRWAQVGNYLPTSAASFITSTPPTPDALSPTAGLLVLVGWVAAGLLVAGVQLQRRDA